MDKNTTIKSRAYQVQSADQPLPELIQLAYGEGEIEFLQEEHVDSPSEFYECMKAQCAFIEEIFESQDELNESCEWNEHGWAFVSSHPLVLQEFAECWRDRNASDEYLFEFFRDSVAEEFGRRPKEYDKYDIDDVVEACKGQYTLIPDEKVGAYWKRLPQGSEAPVRVDTTVEEEVADDEHY